jgi:hypothetical protein
VCETAARGKIDEYLHVRVREETYGLGVASIVISYHRRHLCIHPRKQGWLPADKRVSSNGIVWPKWWRYLMREEEGRYGEKKPRID